MHKLNLNLCCHSYHHHHHHHHLNLSHFLNPPLVNPLTGSAVTPEERTQLLLVREKLMAIKREKCTKCMENWFDLDVKQGVCAKCRKNCKYQDSNQMYPGLSPDLPTLTQMEEMLIAPVHALVQLWQV